MRALASWSRSHASLGGRLNDALNKGTDEDVLASWTEIKDLILLETSEMTDGCFCFVTEVGRENPP